MSEVQSIQRKYSIKSLTLVQVDAEIKDIQKFGTKDKFLKRQGSGGTIMEPGFKALLEQSSREIPDIIICATDGDIEKSFKEVKIPNSKCMLLSFQYKECRVLSNHVCKSFPYLYSDNSDLSIPLLRYSS